MLFNANRTGICNKYNNSEPSSKQAKRTKIQLSNLGDLNKSYVPQVMGGGNVVQMPTLNLKHRPTQNNQGQQSYTPNVDNKYKLYTDIPAIFGYFL